MPEAVKEVVTEVPLAALKKESTPDEVVPCKEVKPAEALSGTLPADEQPQKDAGEEGAIAPDVGQGEAPEQGKSETLNDVSIDEDKENSEKDGKNNFPPAGTEPPAVLDTKSGNSNKDNVAEESKEATSDESALSQESKQPSPEECQIDESKQASPEESKTEQSIDTAATNEQESSQDINETKSDNNPKEKDSTVLVEESTKIDKSNEKAEKDSVVPEKYSISLKPTDELINMNTDVNENKEEAKETKTMDVEDVSKEENDNQINNSEDSHSENREITKEESVNSKDELDLKPESKLEHKEVEASSVDNEKSTKVQSEGSLEEKEKQDNKVRAAENESDLKESMDVSSAKTAADNNQDSSVEKSTEEGAQATQEKSTNEVTALPPTNSSECNVNGSEKTDVKVKNLSNETEGEKKINSQNDSQEKEMTSCSGSSKEVDNDAAEEIKHQVREGKALLLADNYFSAADILGKACEAAGKLYGELANENAELYYLYGCAMLECAKNESNVLGEGVKEKDEEDGEGDEEEANAEVNGDEKMETEENGDAEEEKMAVDDDKEIEEKIDSEQSVKENGLEDDGKNDESTKEKSDEEEEDSSLKVAWEMFELAKIAFTRMGNNERLADTYIKLGEVGIESGHKTALDDMKAALELRKKSSSTNQRLVSETHFNLGLGFATFEMFDDAIEQFKISKSLLEAKIDSLVKVEEEKAKEEIKNIKELLPDLEEKIQDMQDSKVTKEKQTLNGEEPPTLVVSDSAESNGKPVSNITHLVKRKRKLEDVASDLLPSTKQICTEKEADSEKPEN